LDECRIWWLTLVRGDQITIGRCEVLRRENCQGAAPEQLGSVGSELRSEIVELYDKVVVELDKNFTSRHDHMVIPMVEPAR